MTCVVLMSREVRLYFDFSERVGLSCGPTGHIA